MSVPTSLATFFRNHWADRFVDTVLVKTPTAGTLNSTTGVYSPTYATTFSGSALIRPKAGSDAQSGEVQVELRMYNVFVPYTATSVVVDDLVDVTSTNDSYINGKQFVVRNVRGDTYNHVRLLECEEVVG